MMHLKTIAAGSVIAGSLGLAALGIGSGVASAAPQGGPGVTFSQDRGWGPGGPGWNNGPGWDNGPGFDRGRGWGPPPPPPPPPPYYGYGGYDGGGGCVTGPFGLLHFCP